MLIKIRALTRTLTPGAVLKIKDPQKQLEAAGRILYKGSRSRQMDAAKKMLGSDSPVVRVLAERRLLRLASDLFYERADFSLVRQLLQERAAALAERENASEYIAGNRAMRFLEQRIEEVSREIDALKIFIRTGKELAGGQQAEDRPKLGA